MLTNARSDFQEVKRRLHKGSTRIFGYPQLIDTNRLKIAVNYGCIVFMGDGDGDTIGEIIGDGVITGCAAATALDGAADGDADSMGDALG
jgi:hypothetical protein